jgi:hypothetical protein
MNHYIGQIILHNGRYKKVRAIGKGWIETIYLKANEKGWRKVEKIHENKKIDWVKWQDYEALNLNENDLDAINKLLGE